MYQQHHSCSSTSFKLHKIKPSSLSAGIVKNNFKGRVERFVASDDVFSHMR